MAEILEGHKHIRVTLSLSDGTEITFQEATVANLVRAYIGIKTDPQATKIRLTGKRVEARKDGYADCQLMETDQGMHQG